MGSFPKSLNSRSQSLTVYIRSLFHFSQAWRSVCAASWEVGADGTMNLNGWMVWVLLPCLKGWAYRTPAEQFSNSKMFGLNTIFLLYAKHSLSPFRSPGKIKCFWFLSKSFGSVSDHVYGHLFPLRGPDNAYIIYGVLPSCMSLWLHKHSKASQRSTISHLPEMFLVCVSSDAAHICICPTLWKYSLKAPLLPTLIPSPWPALDFNGIYLKIIRWKQQSKKG